MTRAPRHRWWRASGPSAPSLHQQLLLWLLLPQVVLWAAAALFTYKLAGRYTNEAIDASLAQASRALARQIKPTATGLFVDLPRSAQEILEADPKDRVLYAVSSPPGQFLLGDPHLPAARIERPLFGEPYFYDSDYPGPAAAGVADPAPVAERVRVVALYLKFGAEGTTDGVMLVQVARSRADREQLARRILLDTALPLSALVALMTVVVWAGIRAGLRPLAHLRQQLEGREVNTIAPIELRAAPPEVHALAGAINVLIERERAHVVAQRRFLSDAAHQLRTPLAGLKGHLELALGDARDPVQAQRLARAHQGVQRSTRLVGQLLALARSEPEAAAVAHRERIDAVELARALTAEAVPRALAAEVDLGFDEPDAGDGPPARVWGTPLLLREALGNLVDNAIAYAGQGATVTVRVRRHASEVRFEVEDDGPGVAVADRERMFERFVRGTDAGAGCGLGLAIVRGIVERHGGRVELAGAHPKGLVARVTLPADDPRTATRPG